MDGFKEIFIKQPCVMTKQMKICSFSSDVVQIGINEMKYFVSSCMILTVEDGNVDIGCFVHRGGIQNRLTLAMACLYINIK